MSIPILMFHQVAPPPPAGSTYRGLTVSPRAFASQMHWLAMLGWHGVSMQRLTPYLRGEAQGRVFGITFDDAYLNVHQHAMPVLASLGFTATTYVVAGAIGKDNAWDQPEGVAAAALMTHAHLRDWVGAGHEIGAHGVDHIKLTRLDADGRKHQIEQSRRILQNSFDQPVDSFCYPYGDHDEALRQAVRDAGYLNATTTDRGRARPGDDPMALPRVAVWRRTPVLQVWRKCATSYEDRRRSA